MPTPPNRTAYWIALTTAGQGWKMMASMTSAILLSRLLTPADFGLIATTAPIVGFADMIRDAGFGLALIQRADIDQRQAHGLFWLLMALTSVLCLTLIGLSPWIADFFGDRRIIGVLVASTGIMLIGSFGAQPIAWLNRRLNFTHLAIIEMIASTSALLTSTALAWKMQSYWAIVAGGAMSAVMTAVLACLLSGWRPGRPVFDSSVVQMVRFGANVSLSSIMNFMARNADNLIIAKFGSQKELGFYDRAYKLMLLPLTQVTWPIARVMMPILSRIQNDPQEYANLYYRTIAAMMTLTQPAMIAATVAAGPIIELLLGPKWHASAPIFAWLAMAAVHQLVTSSHGWLYLSQGRGRDYAVVGLFGSVTTIVSFLVGIRWGALGVAEAYVISDYALRLPFSWLFVGRTGPVRTRPLLRVALPHVVACGATVGAAIAVRHTLNLPAFSTILIVSIVCYGMYLVVLCAFPRKRRMIATAIERGITKLVYGRRVVGLH